MNWELVIKALRDKRIGASLYPYQATKAAYHVLDELANALEAGLKQSSPLTKL